MNEMLDLESAGKNDYSILSFKACEDRDGNLSGLTFILQSESNTNNIVELSPVGDVSTECTSMLLTGGDIDEIHASYSDSKDAVVGIKYISSNGAKTFGTLLSSFEIWRFSSTNRLMGAQGRTRNNKISQLSFITYFSDCPSYSIVESYNWVDPGCFI